MRRDQLQTALDTIDEIDASGGWTFAKLTIVNAALSALVVSAR